MKKRLAIIAAVIVAALLAVFLRRESPAPRREILRADLEPREGVLFAKGEAAAFAGVLVEDYSPGQRKLEIELRRGKADGLSRGWFENGQLECQETFAGGVSHGVRTRWHPNGQQKSEEQIVGGKLEGAYREWHDNGQNAVMMILRDGQPDGIAEAWNGAGELKSRTRFERGKIVERMFSQPTVAAAEVANP